MDNVDIVDQAFSLGNAVVPSAISSVDSTMWMYIGAALLLAGIVAYFVFFSKPRKSEQEGRENDCAGGFCTMSQAQQAQEPEGTPI